MYIVCNGLLPLNSAAGGRQHESALEVARLVVGVLGQYSIHFVATLGSLVGSRQHFRVVGLLSVARDALGVEVTLPGSGFGLGRVHRGLVRVEV